MIRAIIAIVLATASTLGLAQTADTFPNRPIRFIVPFGTGGIADTIARLIGPKLTEVWGQQIVIENRPGASGNLGMEIGRTAPADGYHYVVFSNSSAASEVILPKLSYDTRRDFVPVAMIASAPMVIAAHPRLAATNMTELVAAIQSRPGRLSYGSCGIGSTHQLAMEIVKFELKISIEHVPYKGCAAGVVDVVAGTIDVMVGPPTSIMPHARAGKLRAIAVTYDKRASSLADIPTVAESGGAGLANYSVDNWYGLLAPAAAPKDIVAKVGAEIDRQLRQSALREQLAKGGIEVRLGSGAQFTAAYAADIAQFKRAVDAAGIKPE